LHSFLTSALCGHWWTTSRPGQFISGSKPAVNTEQETAWDPQPIWRFRGI